MKVLDLVFPKRCAGCGRIGSYICQECEVGRWEEEQVCPSCGRKSAYGERHLRCTDRSLDGVVSLYAYDGLVKRIIEKAKHKGCFDLLNELISGESKWGDRQDLSHWSRWVKENEPVIVPVPLGRRKERERGFNQAEIIGLRLGQNLGLKVKNGLVRIKDADKYTGRNRAEREKILNGAFMVRPQFKSGLKDQKVLLVDDIWTTGATLRECGRVLREAGVRQVWGWVVAERG